MATISLVADSRSFPNVVFLTWETLVAGDVGEAAEYPHYSDKTVTVTGTFDSETLTMQGSNDGTNWSTLTDPQGNNVAFTAAGVKVIAESPRYIRPSLSNAGGTCDIDVIVTANKGSR